jgi:hypothetical protein
LFRGLPRNDFDILVFGGRASSLLRLCGERRGEEDRTRASEERATVYH